ncbi:ADP-forming succinate--CoA ligase subunit beta [Mesorhizobium sp. LHD-90]|uniref:ADP-forming succinate--CoA ligase subunit beta n=1 Tax=Mesorhizobium sp. LHD-90 TaxID=3071414 RepID=UPI0027E03E86|nr:ADP-forming succinate--CoA ligase subunit beta [Mesorhizobium sp. LHD-90]MDQ6436821.1 ADP-forming succinate--CoA ligase subunit beta [Mesorhizobium sp. LHD-90]
MPRARGEGVMRLHEFQAKSLLAGHGIDVPEGRVALTPEDASAIARDLGGEGFAVKAQIRSGGRGKAGAVRIVRTPDEVATTARLLLGQAFVTSQTGPDGAKAHSVLVERAVTAPRSLYLSLSIDAARAETVLLAGAEGGEDIEERVHAGEMRLERLHLTSDQEIKDDEALALGLRLSLSGTQLREFASLLQRLTSAFSSLDATLIEINPLMLTRDRTFVAADAKIIIDDNALFRQPELAALREEQEDNEGERVAQNRQLNYIQMDGDIGLVANGAGLGLATLDMVHAANGRPANFMDIRTTATSLDVAYGFSLLLNNPAVRSILVNVHGGGMQPCDTIADGLGIAMRRTGRRLPTVVRLAGNNAEYARFRFANFGCRVIDRPDMWSAATRAVEEARIAGTRP